MLAVNEIITYVLLFLALYFEVFLLVNYFEIRESKKSSRAIELPLPTRLPSVRIIVPVWNEEKTVLKTIYSLLKLDYPKNLLSISVVDDGSTDKTWNVLQRFARNKQITLLRKENGGKHTAVNFALERNESELVGCLDADSFVHPQALKRIVTRFSDPKVMAVTPAMQVHTASTIIQLMQKVEYGWAIFLRHIFAHLDAQYVIPGPFSIVRMKVFREIGFYRHAYNTEDMEMALRMQAHNYKIANATDAIVYTTTPNTLYKLYKQRLRWTYGFIKNVIDYRHLFFRPQYGHLGMIVLPTASFSLVSLLYLVGSLIVNNVINLFNKLLEIKTVGWSWDFDSFDWFYLNTNVIFFVSLVAFLGTITMVLISRKMTYGKINPGRDIFYFLAFYSFLAPLWVTRAIFNVVFAKQTKWR